MQPIKIYTQPQIEVTIGNDDTVVQVNQSGTPIEITVGGQLVVWGDIQGNLSDQTDLQNALDDKVPYTGATGNVNLGEFGLSTGYVQFDITPTTYTPSVGNLGWNDQEGTIDLLLKGGSVSLPLGQKQVARVVNGTGGNVLKSNYQVVKVTGAQGQRLQVNLAQANNDANSADTLGLIAENINNNNEGFIITSGLVENINTTGSLQGETWADGNTLYLSGTIPGRLTNVKPQAPTHTVICGFVVYAHQNNGKIFVKVDNGYEIDELHNVKINSPTNGQVLKYNSTLAVWENSTDQAGTGTVTSIATSSPITGGTITTSGTIGITQATTSTDGYLSSTDWNTFNNKQNVLTNPITGTGSSGQVAYFNGSTSITSESNLFWDEANNRLGIGTTTPSYSLQTNGDISINGVLIGRGLGNDSTNTRVGLFSLTSNTNGNYNSSFGESSLRSNTEGYFNQAFGNASLFSNTLGYNNSAFGGAALRENTTGSNNTAVGLSALYNNTTGSNNTALGFGAGTYAGSGFLSNETSSNSIYLGYQSRANASGDTNEIVIGYDVVGLGSNTTVIGNSSTTSSKLFGTLEVGTVNNATTDTDRFLVSNGGVISYRTGSELLSDIGGQSALTNPITGTGTTNELTYFTGSTTVSSLSTATYPSLTELSYVKGVTSSIQTQLNGKQATLTNPITGTGTSGQVAYFNGTTSLTGSATFAFTPTSQLLVNNSVTASGAIARGTNLTPSLTAAANSDVLVGLDVNPTFTNGAFTSVVNAVIRSLISSGTGRWNLYITGTASNHLAGNLLLGSTTDTGEKLQVTGTSLFTGNSQFNASINATTFSYSASAGQTKTFSTQGVLAGTKITFSDANTYTGTGNITYILSTGSGFAPTSGSGTFVNLNLQPTINQTGGASGITRGLYVQPTLTSAADWRSIETSNNTGYAAYFGGSADLFFNDATDLQFGTTTGTKIGTATTQKISFWNATPIVQPANTVAINDVLVNLGLRASGGVSNFTGQLQFSSYTTSSSYSGTAAGYLAFDSSGNVLTVAVPGALIDGDKGDITVSSSGTTWTIDNTAVTYAKIQNVTDNRLLGRSAGTSGSVQEITIGSGLSLSGGTLTSTGGSSYSISTKTANFTETATSGEIILLGDTTGGTFTITLPTAVSNTAKITIKKIAGSNTLTVDGNGSQTIDGGLTASLVTVYESITLVSDNSNWHII